MKKTTKTMIIAIVGLALLVGVFLLVYFLLPQQPSDSANTESTASGETASGSDTASEGELTEHEEYTLVSHIPSDIEKIEVTNDTGSYTILSNTPTVEVTASDGTASTETQATEYTLVGYEDLSLLSGSPDALANDAASMTAGKIVDDGSRKSEFGFDKPRATVTAYYKGGDSATFIVGDDAPDDMGTYLMMKGDSNIYLVAAEYADGFLITNLGMISTEIGHSANDEAGNVFSKMVLGGTLFGKDVVFEYSDNENFSETFKITSPDKVLANEETVTSMLYNVRSLTATEVMAVNADDAKIAEYGLDKPYATVEAEYPDLSVSYKATKPDDEGYIYLLSGGIIYKLESVRTPWLLHTYDECISEAVLTPKSSAVTGVTIEANGNKYEFKQSGEGDSKTYTCNGKNIDEANYSTFYQNVASAKRAGGLTEIPSGKKTVLTVEYILSDGSTEKAEYFEGEDGKCAVAVNGEYATTAYDTYVNKIIEDAPKAAANQATVSVS